MDSATLHSCLQPPVSLNQSGHQLSRNCVLIFRPLPESCPRVHVSPSPSHLCYLLYSTNCGASVLASGKGLGIEIWLCFKISQMWLIHTSQMKCISCLKSWLPWKSWPLSTTLSFIPINRYSIPSYQGL